MLSWPQLFAINVAHSIGPLIKTTTANNIEPTAATLDILLSNVEVAAFVFIVVTHSLDITCSNETNYLDYQHIMDTKKTNNTLDEMR